MLTSPSGISLSTITSFCEPCVASSLYEIEEDKPGSRYAFIAESLFVANHYDNVEPLCLAEISEFDGSQLSNISKISIPEK